MSAKDIVLKPITDVKVAKKNEKALLKTKEKEETLKKAKNMIEKEDFIF